MRAPSLMLCLSIAFGFEVRGSVVAREGDAISPAATTAAAPGIQLSITNQTSLSGISIPLSLIEDHVAANRTRRQVSGPEYEGCRAVRLQCLQP